MFDVDGKNVGGVEKSGVVGEFREKIGEEDGNHIPVIARKPHLGGEIEAENGNRSRPIRIGGHMRARSG